MRLFFDTETSGLKREGVRFDSPDAPHLVQIGAALFDPKWKRVGGFNVLIKPNGWAIEAEAEKHHGISLQRCQRYGVELEFALGLFKGLVENALQIVAHHMEFDRSIVLTGLHRCGSDGLWWRRRAKAMVCTMEIATPVIGLPGNYGRPKFPSLEEAHRHFYPERAFTSRHDAEDDLNACVEVYRALQKTGAVPEPSMEALL